MVMSYLLFFLLTPLFAQGPKRIEVLPNPKSIEDFDHLNKGCPENSECDVVMGVQLQRWKELIKKVKEVNLDAEKKIKYLEAFRERFGIPVEFYTTTHSQLGFKPLLFNSPCREHNPKEGEKIFRGTTFVKALNEKFATVWRDQTKIEVPLGKLFMPQPVTVFGEETKDFFLPIDDQPLFMRDGDLFVLREEEQFFYFLRISPQGDWKIENVDQTRLSLWENKREEVKCPAGLNEAENFHSGFCKTIWDETHGKLVPVRMHLGCVI